MTLSPARVTKRCYRCKTSKPRDEFQRNRAKRDGLRDECRSCCREVATGRPRSEAQRRLSRATAAAWQKANPQKHAAQQALGRALKSGRLTRPDACEDCGASCKPDGHHEDYSKPLDVRWLCRLCHCQVHRLPAHGLSDSVPP